MERKAVVEPKGNLPERAGSLLPYAAAMLSFSLFFFFLMRMEMRFPSSNEKAAVLSGVVGKAVLSEMPEGWEFKDARKNEDGAAVFRFVSPAGTDIELFLMPADPRKPCYERTGFYNIAYRARGRLSSPEEAFIRSRVDAVKKHENNNNILDDIVSFFSANVGLVNLFLSVIFKFLLSVLFAVLIFDLAIAALRRRSRDKETGCAKADLKKTAGLSAAGKYLPPVLSAILVAVLMIGKLHAVNRHYFSFDDFFFSFPLISGQRGYLTYVVAETGFPSIPYRAVYPLLFKAGSMELLRGFAAVFTLLSVWAVYRLSARHMRPALAWVVPVVMFASGIFERPLGDLRGYSLFIFFGIYSILLFDGLFERICPIRLFLWLFSSVAAMASNPLAVAVVAPQPLYYFFVIRKRMEPGERRMFSSHVLLLATYMIFFAALSLRTVSHHAAAIGAARPTEPFLSGLTPLFGACAVLFAIGAIVFRKDGRGSVMTSALLGISAVVVIFALNILPRRDHYYLLVLPVVAVSLGIFAEAVVKKLESVAGKQIAWSKVFAGTAVFIIILFIRRGYFADLSARPYESYLRENIIEVQRLLSEKNREGAPVLVYPQDRFSAFLIEKYKFGFFEGDPKRNRFFDLETITLETGERLLKLDDYYSSGMSVRDPAVFGRPVFIVIFDLSPDIGGKYFSAYYPWYARCMKGGCRVVSRQGKTLVVYYRPQGKPVGKGSSSR